MQARIVLSPTRTTGTMNKPQLRKGHQSLLSPAFKYVQAMETDLSKTFARVRLQQVVVPAKSGTVSVLKLRDGGAVKRSQTADVSRAVSAPRKEARLRGLLGYWRREGFEPNRHSR